MLDIKAVFNKLKKKGRRSIESLLKWIGTNVEKEKINTLEMSKQACLTEDSEVVKYLINNINLSPLDVMSILMSSMNRSWQSDNKDLIQWICSNVDLKEINIMNIIDKACKEERYDELEILLKNMKENHSTVLRNACKNKQLKLIKILLSVVDHDILNMRDAVTSVCVVEKMELLEFFLYNVDHSLYDVHHVLKESCRYGWTHIVKWLLDNIEHTSLDINTAMHTVLHREFMGPDNTLVRQFFQYSIHDKFDVAEIIKECCWWGLLDLVQLICEKNDVKQLDMKEAMNTACSRSQIDLVEWMLSNIENNLFDMPTAFDKAIHADFDDLNASLIFLLKDYTDHKLIDMAHLLMIGCQQCWYDIVNWVLGNADHTVLDVDKAMNSVYIKWMFYKPYNDDIEINCRRVKYEPLIKMILEKVNHSLLDLKEVFNQACHYASLDVVILVLENTDDKKIYVKKALDILYTSWMYDDTFDEFRINERRDKYEPLIKLMIEKVNFDSLVLKKVLNQACQYGFFDIVKLVLENTDHKLLDVKKATNKLYDAWKPNYSYSTIQEIEDRRDKDEKLIKLIIEKVKHDSLDLQILLNLACCCCSLDVVTLLLENTDHTRLNVKETMNIICDSWECSDSYVYVEDEERRDTRGKYEQLIKLILDKVNHDSLDLQKVFDCACRYCSLDVVTLLIEKKDHTMFNGKETINIICNNWKYSDSDFYDDDEEISDERDEYEQLIKLILFKVNLDSYDLQQVFDCACRVISLDVVTLLLEKTDHKMLAIQKALSIICDKWASLDRPYYFDDEGKYDRIYQHEQLIILIIDKVNHDSLDLQKVLDCACFNKSLDVVTLLLKKADHKLLDVQEALKIKYDQFDDYFDDDDVRDIDKDLFELILENVNYDSLDLKIVLFLACNYGAIDVITLLLEKTDHIILDVKKALRKVIDIIIMFDKLNICKNRERYTFVVKLFLEKVNHSLLDLPNILKKASHMGLLDTVTLLLENTDHKNLDVNGAMNAVNVQRFTMISRNNYKHLIKLFLGNVNHSLINFKEILNKACADHSLDTITWLLSNYDHALFDLNNAMRKACESEESRIIKYLVENCDNTLLDITDAMTRILNNNIFNDGNEEIIKYLFRKVNKELIDDKILQNVPYKLCLPFIITWCFKIFDNTTHGVPKAILDKIFTEHDYMNMVRSNEGLTLIQILDTDINSDNFDRKDIMNKACSFGCLDTVTWLLDYEDHSRFDLKMAMFNTFNSRCLCKEELIQLLLEKCVVDEFDMEINMNEACKQGMFKIVTWLIENIDHRLFDLNPIMSHLYHHFTDRNQQIFKLLVANVSYKLFDLGSVIEQAFRQDLTEIIIWLLQTQDHSLLNVKYVMNEACRVGNLRIIKHVCGTMDKEYFDSRSAMNKACRSSKTNSVKVVKWLWENLQHSMVDMESAMNNACRYDNIAVVEWLWTNIERQLFNVKNAWNNACYNCNKKLLSYLLNNMSEHILDKSKALVHACRNNKEGYKVISLLLGQPNMNTPENCKLVLTEACVHGNKNVVKWLLSNTNIQPLEYKDTLIDTIKATINKSNKKDKTHYENLVRFMVNHRMIKKLDRNDLSIVMEAVSSIGQLNMVKQLWYKTAKSMFNMSDIVNTACKSGKLEIADWLLQKIALKNLDVQTVMVESCGYGWLKIVNLLVSKCEMKILDISTAMDEACSYGQYDIVSFLLKNVDTKTLNTKLVLEKACGYGWKDIVNWSFDNSNDTSFDLNECLLEAFVQGRLEIIEIFFSKYGAKHFDVNILVDKSCNNCGNAGVMKFLIENFELKQTHLNIIMKNACKYSWTEMVSSILDRCKHDKNIMEEAMKNVCNNGESEIVEIFLAKIDISFLGVKTNMVISCQKGWDEIVSLLLERVDHSLFDLTVAMNEACRCGEADIVELLIQKVNHKHFNFDTAIEEACKSHLNENLVLTLLKYINCSTIDIDGKYKKAREYGWRKVGSRLKRMSYNEN